MILRYHLLDVFTNQRFGGNPLAVFTDPPLDLRASAMQAIAKELNLSETTFVFPPQDPANDFRVRIFTPAAELPMAGHPTVGTAWLLARLGALGAIDGSISITFEEGVGPIEVIVKADDDGNPSRVLMRQPLPTFLDIHHDRAAIAAMLSISLDDLRPSAPCQVVSCGLPFLYVVVNSLDAIRRVCLRPDLWRELLQGADAEQVFVTTAETEYPGSTAHSRMFAPALGVAEDPATGSASGPLGAYLLKYGLAASSEMVSEQGIEMGRPSFIDIYVGRSGDQVTNVIIGGECVYMGQGALYLD